MSAAARTANRRTPNNLASRPRCTSDVISLFPRAQDFACQISEVYIELNGRQVRGSGTARRQGCAGSPAVESASLALRASEKISVACRSSASLLGQASSDDRLPRLAGSPHSRHSATSSAPGCSSPKVGISCVPLEGRIDQLRHQNELGGRYRPLAL